MSLRAAPLRALRRLYLSWAGRARAPDLHCLCHQCASSSVCRLAVRVSDSPPARAPPPSGRQAPLMDLRGSRRVAASLARWPTLDDTVSVSGGHAEPPPSQVCYDPLHPILCHRPHCADHRTCLQGAPSTWGDTASRGTHGYPFLVDPWSRTPRRRPAKGPWPSP